MSIIFDNVYEDPRLEVSLCKAFSVKKVLCIASGGCTALTLKNVFPNIQVNVVDTNPSQLELVKAKVKLLESGNKEQINRFFNIGAPYEESFSNQAVFNKINRCLRFLTNELLISEFELVELFSQSPYSIDKAKVLLHNPFWDLIFQMVYSTSLVSVVLSKHVSHMLIRDKIGNFLCNNIRAGLCSDYACKNYILQRLFLGYYLPTALPIFLSEKCKRPYAFQYYPMSLEEVPDLETYDLLSLSNICSWMNIEQMRKFIHNLSNRLRPGAIILLRETSALRNPELNPFDPEIFQPLFLMDKKREKTLLELESSMLFDQIFVGFKK
ncbi:MAG: hypothetical protein A3E87_04805 [Gammaproteobacteria bacterium RIFCSPHIGHO2_12_FULL_35_23]|nr:MAG: hypothetical protein A3E87_04805 [Gammaproteobacteria bacterium RIFCSPHIGHO2_12_FULL_35_23]